MRMGPVPEKAIELLLPVARARGFVIRCARNRKGGIDLVIAAPGLTAFVCVSAGPGGCTNHRRIWPFSWRYRSPCSSGCRPAPGDPVKSGHATTMATSGVSGTPAPENRALPGSAGTGIP